MHRFEQRNIAAWTGWEAGQNHQNASCKDPTDFVILAEYLRRWLVHGFYLLEVAAAFILSGGTSFGRPVTVGGGQNPRVLGKMLV